MRRAALAAEFALAQWLVRGLAADDQTMVDEAVEMLNELESDVAEHGGQPISVTAPPPPAAPPTIPAAAFVPAAAPGAPEQETADGPAGAGGSAGDVPAGKPGNGGSTDGVMDQGGGSGSAEELDSAAGNPGPSTTDSPRVHLSGGSGHRKVTLLPVEDPEAAPTASATAAGLPASPAPASPETTGPDRAESTDGEDAPGNGPASVDTTALPVINQQ